MLTDEQLVEKARALLAERKKLRWHRLICGVALLAICIWMVVDVVQKLEKQDSMQLTVGFFMGIGLAFLCATIGIVGAVLLAQSRSGFQGDMRSRELLVTYHDRLRELQAMPANANTDQTNPPGSTSASPRS
jgi:uncharacterized membrane protein